MIHSFDIDIAQAYGVNAAIILNNMYFWVEKNRANETNFHDGRYWTYNSVRAFSKLFPYLSARAISTAIKKLVDDGLVVTGNYNKSSYDRTLWYAITEKGYSILQNCKMEDSKVQNGNNENVPPIPDIKPDPKPDIKPEEKKERKNSFDAIIDLYLSPDGKSVRFEDHEKRRELLQEWLKVRKAKRAAMTDRAIQLNIDKLDKLARASHMSVTEYLSEVICRGWAAFYEIKNFKQVPVSKVSGDIDYGSPEDFYK